MPVVVGRLVRKFIHMVSCDHGEALKFKFMLKKAYIFLSDVVLVHQF